MGHEDAFPPTMLSNRYRLGKPTFVGRATAAGKRRFRSFVGARHSAGRGPAPAADCSRSRAPSALYRGAWASGKLRHEPDQITTIVQPLIIDGPIHGGIGRALNEEDRAAGRHLERLDGNRVGGGFQLVSSLDPKRTILVLRQCEDPARPQGRPPQPSHLGREAGMSPGKTSPQRRRSEHVEA